MSARSTIRLARARAGLEEEPELPPADPGRLSVFPSDRPRGLSYVDWYESVEPLAACLRRYDVHSGDRILILSETRMEWLQADLATVAAGGLSVPVYTGLPASQIGGILADSGAEVAFVSNPVLQAELLRAPGAERIRLCILMPPTGGPPPRPVIGPEGTDPAGDLAFPPAGGNGANPPGAPAAPQAGSGADPARTLAWERALELGREAPAATFSRIEAIVRGLDRHDPATIIYTSGTSGRMKGVLLTHGNLLASAVSSAQRLAVGSEDTYLAFLPMSHVLERVVQLSMLWAGAKLHYSAGLDRLEADFRRARPTVVVGVPRLYEKILRGAREQARRKGQRAQVIFRLAERAAIRAGRRGPRRRPAGLAGWLWDALVYRRVRRVLGGRTRLLISGGAPLGRGELLFLNGAGLPTVEGYGLTETASVVTVGLPREWKAGSVGRALPGTEVRIGPEGEVLVRGHSVMRGYWNDEAGTNEALRDGWLHTGDLGRIDDDGFLFLTDRKKDLIVTAHGKKVAPQMVEAQLRASPLIHDVVITGDRRPYVVGLVYPDLEVLRARAALALPEGKDLRRTLDTPGVRALFRAEIERCCQGLAPHEVVREFVLIPEKPAIVDGSLTPTHKLRRTEIERRYAREIRGMYDRR